MSVERFKTNPFLEGMIIPVKGKQVRLSKLGRDDNVLINQSTGEVHGTHVTTYKSVDSEQFVKLFTANIALTFNLQSAGIKTLTVVIWMLQNHAMAKDEIALDQIVLDDFLEEHQDRKPPISLSIATLKRGITELESRSSPKPFGKVGISSTQISSSTATESPSPPSSKRRNEIVTQTPSI